MSDDTFRKMVAEMPQEAWAITGVDSNGHFWCSRLRVGAPESQPYKTSAALKKARKKEAARMNSLGACVRVVHERIGDDLCWHEVAE